MTIKWILHSCPRCNGDLFIESDEEDDVYEECLQCGYRKLLSIRLVVKKHEQRQQRV